MFCGPESSRMAEGLIWALNGLLRRRAVDRMKGSRALQSYTG